MTRPSLVARSEQQLQSKLSDSRITRAGDRAKSRGGGVSRRVVEVDTVSEIEKLSVELQLKPFAPEGNLLE
jgi:hypothetical protein